MWEGSVLLLSAQFIQKSSAFVLQTTEPFWIIIIQCKIHESFDNVLLHLQNYQGSL